MTNTPSRSPKIRPELPPPYIRVYEAEYLSNRTSGGIGNKIARFLEGWMHNRVRKARRNPSERLLELGAGSLNHVPWEKEYSTYDVVEPFKMLTNSSPLISSIGAIYSDISQAPKDNRYDRIFSIAVFGTLNRFT